VGRKIARARATMTFLSRAPLICTLPLSVPRNALPADVVNHA
jgi:hypothetical protein